MSFSCDTGRLWRDGQGRGGTGVAQHGHVATLCRIFMLLTRVFLALICRPPPLAHAAFDWDAICCGFSAFAKFAQFLRFEICTNYTYRYFL